MMRIALFFFFIFVPVFSKRIKTRVAASHRFISKKAMAWLSLSLGEKEVFDEKGLQGPHRQDGFIHGHDFRNLRAHSHRVTSRPPLYDSNHAMYACPQKGKNVVYLTLDDGPGNKLGELTDKMKELGIQATFFWNGQNIPDSRSRKRTKNDNDDQTRGADIKKAVAAGHAVGTHGLSHRDLKDVHGQEGMREHVIEGAQVIQTALKSKKGTGSTALPRVPEVNLYRPPYGSWNGDANQFFSSRVGSGFHVIRWDVDTSDWMSHGSDTQGITKTVANAVDGDGGEAGHVILMHESGHVVQEITSLVQAIRSKCPTCEFWSIDQCFAAEAAEAGKMAPDASSSATVANAMNKVLADAPSESSVESVHTLDQVDFSESGKEGAAAADTKVNSSAVKP